jgi:signal transduction histidine kinase
MRLILQGYLSFSRPLEKLQRAPVDLGGLADELLQLLAPRARAAGVRMSRTGAASIDADVRKLREGLFNLIANALEATPPGGRVELTIEPSLQGTRVLVRDTGRGMTPEVLERIGTPFFTTREQGSGLGVALARAAFEQHGGSLCYTSSLGAGSVATVQLPTNVEA